MRSASRSDVNQREIVAALRRVGASVEQLHRTGKSGCPDLLVGHLGVTYLLECKNVKGHDRGRLSPIQVEWHAAWRGRPVAVVHNVDEALEVIGVLSRPGVVELTKERIKRRTIG